jgi:hypothetical protein
MIEFGGQNAGWPWHGIYRASTGKLTTAGGDIDLPGQAPNDGDCYLIQIPGLPTPDVSPDEVSAGMVWKNYALIYAGRLYGKDLGGIVYIDSENRPWRVFVTRGGTRTQKEIRVTVAAQRFGVVGPGAAPTLALAQMTVSFETHPDYPSGFAGNTDLAQILDVATNGKSFLVGVPRYRRGFAAIAEITLSGSPADGNFASNMSLLADELAIDNWSGVTGASSSSGRWWLGLWREVDWSSPPVADSNGNYPVSPGAYYAANGDIVYFDGSSYATHATYSLRLTTGGAQPDSVANMGDGYMSSVFSYRPFDVIRPNTKWLCGARYDASGAAKVIAASIDTRTDYDEPSFDDTPAYVSLSDSVPATASFGLIASAGVCTVSAEITAGETVLERSEQVVTTTTPGDDSYAMTLTRNGSLAETVTYSAPLGSGYSYIRFGGGISPASYITSTLTADRDVGVRRVTNSVYQSIMPGLAISNNSSSPISLVTQKYAGRYSGRLGQADYVAYYASEHPVTGDIEQGSDTVCWV